MAPQETQDNIVTSITMTQFFPSHETRAADMEATTPAVYYLPAWYSPSDKDILCGRGKLYAKHPANKVFSQIIRANLSRYMGAPKRIDKSIVVASVVSELQNSGFRFIKQDLPTKTARGKESSSSPSSWYVLSDDATHEKTGHAIRDLLKVLDTRGELPLSASSSKAGPKSPSRCRSSNKEAPRKSRTRQQSPRQKKNNKVVVARTSSSSISGGSGISNQQNDVLVPEDISSLLSSSSTSWSPPAPSLLSFRRSVIGVSRTSMLSFYEKKQGKAFSPTMGQSLVLEPPLPMTMVGDAVLNLSEEYSCSKINPAHQGPVLSSLDSYLSDPFISSQLLDALSDEDDDEDELQHYQDKPTATSSSTSRPLEVPSSSSDILITACGMQAGGKIEHHHLARTLPFHSKSSRMVEYEEGEEDNMDMCELLDDYYEDVDQVMNLLG